MWPPSCAQVYASDAVGPDLPGTEYQQEAPAAQDLSVLAPGLAHHLDLSRFRAAPSARLSHFPFEGDGVFPAQC